MQSGIYTFYKLNQRFKAFLLCLMLLFIIPKGLKSQNKISQIIRLNELSDSLSQVDVPKARSLAEDALKLSLEIKNDSLEYESRFNKGVANFFLGNINVALEDFIKSKELSKKLGSPKRTIESMNAIGNAYRDIDRYDLALQSFKESIALCYSSSIKDKLLLIQFNIATVYSDLQKHDSCIRVCNRVLLQLSKLDRTDNRLVSNINSTILSAYTSLKNVDSVNKYSAIVLKTLKERGEKLNYAGNLFNIGYFHYSISDYSKAESYLKEALDENPENIELLIDISKNLGHTYAKQKKYDKAAEMYRDCLHLKDSLYQIQTIDKISEMEVKYETGKKEEELKRLGAEKEVTDLKAKQSRLWLIASSVGILSVVIVAFVLFRQNKSRQQANKLLQQQNDEIVHQKKEITDSINYAKRIQLAILPPDKMVKQLLPNAFVLYKPKDVVSGDFYWMEEKNGMILFAAVDCTGHGVPGAMMSVVGLNLLNQAVKEKGLTTPSEILKHLDTGVTDTLRQSADKDSIKDGMDLSLCAYDPKTLELQYAGAFNNLWVVRKNISSSYTPQTKNEIFFEEHLLEIKADKFPIGSNVDGVADNYTNYKLKLQKGDCVYLYSDGFADQFGGPKGKKFKYNALKKFLVSVHELPPAEQREKLLSAFESWRGNLEQVDDILVIGVCV
jgi:serine phosphatase RsbU (regulator of sigma subunit)